MVKSPLFAVAASAYWRGLTLETDRPDMANPDPTPDNVAALATQKVPPQPRDPVLIGTFGTDADAKALLRLPSGRVARVEAGNRVAGLQVTAIAPGTLHATRRGQPMTLTIPGK